MMVAVVARKSNDLLDEWKNVVDAMGVELIGAILEQGIYQHKDNEVLNRMRKVLEDRMKRIINEE